MSGAEGRFPKSLLEFQGRFAAESACAEYLFERRWPEGFVCPGCGRGRAWLLKTKAFTYECADCAPPPARSCMMLIAHRAGNLATVAMVTGALITGSTVLSAFTACRVYLSEQFPTALRRRGQPFSESTGRLFAGVLAPFLMEPHTGSATISFGTIFVVVAIGTFIPLVFGRRAVGQLETVTEGVPALA